MAEANDGDRTEKPTPKRLKDARKKGNVAKSKELTSVATLLAWLVIGSIGMGYAAQRLAGGMQHVVDVIGRGWGRGDFAKLAASMGWEWLMTLMALVAVFLIPAAAIGLLVEFLQAGPVLSFEKVTPKAEHMNPAEGLERMFSVDNIVELLKSVAKTALLLVIGWLVIASLMPQIVGLAGSSTHSVLGFGAIAWQATFQTVIWTVAVFAMVAALDAGWQYHRYIRKLRMSRRDIRQEMKESEGDPLVKQQRRQAHAEWSQRNAQSAARTANALVVNPTHVAIAIQYDKESCPVPTVSAKGEDHVARAMREAAEEAGVPIVRNVPLARDMLARAEEGEIIPPDLFDVIAEVVLWAREAREQWEYEEAMANAAARGEEAPQMAPKRKVAPPGEDLTRYPDVHDLRRATAAYD
jgi:type III secretion protein U